MAKKSYKRTMDENKIHEKAVKMRKKTDEQLVHYVEDREAKARSEGFNEGKAVAKEYGKGIYYTAPTEQDSRHRSSNDQ